MSGGKNPNRRLQNELEQLNSLTEEQKQKMRGSFRRLIAENMMAVNDIPKRRLRLPHDYAYDDAKPESLVTPKVIFGPTAVVKHGQTPRVVFAEWLTSKDNPRFVRTIANRLWKIAFGVGQIEPVDDMREDTRAENPQLMSYLESEMKRLDFEMKEYLRVLFNTKTYQRKACFDEVHLGDEYHFPGPVLRRMTAEQVWDSFLTLAVVEPNEYRELPSAIRTDIVKIDLKKVQAQEILDKNEEARTKINRTRSKRQKKYRYRGVLLARASELPSPVPPDHFLRVFGQSDRELIDASSQEGSVPQVLAMFNGVITHMLLVKGSTMYNNVMERKTERSRIEAIFLTILSRKPDERESAAASREIQQNGNAGYGNVIWSLVNTREFLFIQ